MTRPLFAILVIALLAACAGPPTRQGPEAAPDSPRTSSAATSRPAPRSDSLRPRGDGSALLVPAALIGDERINEGSGLAYAGGWWWTHNDSGDGPFLFRSRSPWFDEAERIEVPGAKAVDWEELAVLGDDLLVCDIGDNGRAREDVTIYRVRPTESGVELVATYPVTYPDGKHDAEGVWVWDGRVHIVLKNRGEEAHWVYRFPELRDGEPNTPRVIGSVAIPDGEQVTAADANADGQVAMLTYSQLLFWSAERVNGAPERAFTLHARQCEALAWTESGIVLTNEQRDAYLVDRPLACDLDPWVPIAERVRLERVPPGPGGDVALDLLPGLPVRNLRDGEHVRAGLVRDQLVIDVRVEADTEILPTEDGRLGTALLLAFARGAHLRITPDDPAFAVPVIVRGEPVVPLPLSGAPPTADLGAIRVETVVLDENVGLQIRIPVNTLFPDGLPRTFRMALVGSGFRKGEDEPLLGALDFYGLFRPFVWAAVSTD